jgi:hypothetical protein
MNRVEAIDFIFKKENGTKNELINKIGERLYKEYCLLGYIQQGINAEHDQTWQKTSLTDFQQKFNAPPTSEEKELGRYLVSIGY